MKIEYLHDLVKKQITYNRFLEEIEKRREKYGNLLDDEAIAYLIVDEYGANSGNFKKIGELIDGINATVEGEVIEISEIEKIKSKDKNLLLQKIKIRDDSGECSINFWNNDIEKIQDLKMGDKVKIINGYVKENEYGLSISIGKWGTFTKKS